jgi:lipopolysaccharide export system permease protein
MIFFDFMMNFKNFKLSIITKYVLKEFLLTFLLTFSFFFITFFINFILVNIKPLLEKSLPFDLVAVMMISYFPDIIIFSLPFGTMLATLMTMGRFSSDNEIIAFKSLGFNMMKVFTPIFICSFIITIITFFVNDRLVPIAWHQRIVTMKKVSSIKPTLNFKSKTVKKQEKKTIYTNIVEDTKIEGLIIIDVDDSGNKRIISAKSADIVSSKQRSGVIELKLYNTMIQFENKDRPGEFNFGYSDTLTYYVDLQEFYDESLENIPSIAKYTIENYQDVQKYKKGYLFDVYKRKVEISKLKNDIANDTALTNDYLNNNKDYNIYIQNLKNYESKISNCANLVNDKINNLGLNVNLLEFYRKFTNPLACIIFAIFAAPIGIFSRKAGFQIGFILGLFLTGFYWFAFVASMTLGRKFVLTPFIAMSLPNLFFLVIGVIALLKRLKE